MSTVAGLGPIPAAAGEAADDSVEIDRDVEAAAHRGDDVPVIVTFHDGSSTPVEDTAADAGVEHVTAAFPTIEAVATSVDAAQLRTLADDPRVATIEADLPVVAADDAAQAAIGVPQAAAELGATGDSAGDGAKTYSNGDVVVAVLDSGVHRGHLALDEGKVRTSQNFASGCPTPSTVDWDDHADGHGTHVAAIVAGDGDAVSGVAPAAAIVDLKVLCGGGGWQSDINAALNWVLENRLAWGIDVVNLSLSVTGCGSNGLDSTSKLVNQVVAAGVVVAAAAGNSSSACAGGNALGTVTAPGSARYAIGVGAAADPLDVGGSYAPGWRIAEFSLRGPSTDGRIKPDVVAPGADVISADGASSAPAPSTTRVLSGTSMASPMVAGVAGLLVEMDDSLRPTGVICGSCTTGVADATMANPALDILRRTSTDWGLPGPDHDSGWGIIDAYRALSRAAGSAGGSPQARACTMAARGAVGGSSSEAWTAIAQGSVPVTASTLTAGGVGQRITVGSASSSANGRVVAASATAVTGQLLTINVQATTATGFAYTLELSGASLLRKTAANAVAGSCGPSSAGRYTPLGPARALDTRITGGPIGPASIRTLSMVGAGVPANAVAAVLNVTVTEPTAPSFVSVFPSGSDRPPTSTVNMTTGQVVANAALIGLAANATVDLYNHNGSTHVVVDVTGYFSASGGAGFVPVAPSRLLDTRLAGGPVGPGGTRSVAIAPQVAPADATAAVLNVTVDQPTAAGFLSVYPDAWPGTSSLNFVAGQTVPNLVPVPLSANGTVTILNTWGSSHVIVDFLGYYRPGSGASFHPLRPARVLDTRDSTGGWSAALGSGAIYQDVTDLVGVPASGVVGISANITATEASAATHVTVWPSDMSRPGTSNLNLVAGGTKANLVNVGVGAGGFIWLAGFAGATHIIADVTGFFA